MGHFIFSAERIESLFGRGHTGSFIVTVNLLCKVEMACSLIRCDFLEVYVLFQGPSGQEKVLKLRYFTCLPKVELTLFTEL